MISKRINLLDELILFKRDISCIIIDLNKMPFDSDFPLIFLEKDHVIGALTKFINKEINDDDLEEWAEAIDGRDDIGVRTPYEVKIREILNKIANKHLFGKIDISSAKNYIHHLNKISKA